MKEFKGTPGPWFLGGVENEKQSVNAAGYYIALIDECACRNANARLIAAAPDLLSALQAVIRVADRDTDEFIAARAAVVKALGESQ